MGRRSSGEKRVQLNVTIPEVTMKKLDDVCAQHYSCSRSKVVEAALKKFLAEKGTP